jgi:flagellar hook-associated protein 2
MAEISTTDNIGSKITMALKAGSGVDINELATSLSEAESMPTINAVTAKKASATVSISGYGVLKTGVSSLKAKLDALQDRDTLLSKSVSTSDSNSTDAEISSQSLAKAGTTRIIIHTLAQPEVTEVLTAGGSDFSSAAASISGLTTVTLTSDSQSSAIAISDTTPRGIVAAINAANLNGITARTLNKNSSGTAVSILVEGTTGANNSFTITTNLSGGAELTRTEKQGAQDLKLKVNNLEWVYRDTNSPTDVIEGVQLRFKAANTTATRNIVVSSNSSGLKDSIDSFIETYNDLVTLTDYLTGDKDADDELAGSLSSDKSSVNLLLSKTRSLLNLTSASASNGFSNLRDIGISSILGGKLKLQESVYAAAVKTNFSDIRTMLTADTNDQPASSLQTRGLALDASIILEALVSDTGSITTRKTTAETAVTRYADELLKLQERLDSAKQRYLMQFAAMETLVQRSKNTGDYLTGQFKAMESMYSK